VPQDVVSLSFFSLFISQHPFKIYFAVYGDKGCINQNELLGFGVKFALL
jgi:hypothetical protein